MWPNNGRSRSILACLLGLWPAATTARADWLANGNPVATITGYQSNPRVVTDRADGAFACWGQGGDARVQRFTASGGYAAGWPAAGVSAPVMGWPFTFPRWPVLAEDGAGGAYVVVTTLFGCYAHCNQEPRVIRVQRLTPDGSFAPGWPPEGVSVSRACAVTGPRTAPLVASNGEHGVLIAWENYVQSIGPDSARRWGEDGMVLSARPNDRSLPQIISDLKGGAFVFWGEFESPGRHGRVFGQHVSATGERLWGADGIPVSETYELLRASPAVVPDGSQGAIVAWCGSRGADFDIYAARVTHGGGLPWRQDLLVCRAAGERAGTRMIPLPGGGAIVAWRDTHRTPAGAVYAQRLAHGGRVAWTPDGVPVCASTGPQGFPALAWDGSDGAYFAWGENRLEGELYAMRLTRKGTPAPGWPSSGALLCAWPPSWYDHHYGVQGLDMTFVGDRSAIVVWNDTRAIPFIPGLDDDLSFAMLLTPEGPEALAGAASIGLPSARVAGLPATSPRPAFAIRGVWPNPAPGDFVVRLALPVAARARLELLDLSGRSLWALEQSLGPGEHEVPVPVGRHITPGVYFLRLAQEGRIATARIAVVQ